MKINSTSRAFNELSDAAFKSMTRQLTFCAIAFRYNIDEKTVSRRAKNLEVVPFFSRKSTGALSQEEKARILKLREDGKSLHSIGKEINRAHSTVQYVSERNSLGEEDRRKNRHKGPRLPWPEMNTDIKEALRGQRYSDIPSSFIEKEWPSYKRPLDGRFIVSRIAERSEIGCATFLCYES